VCLARSSSEMAAGRIPTGVLNACADVSLAVWDCLPRAHGLHNSNPE
jgi:hypothetical protein